MVGCKVMRRRSVIKSIELRTGLDRLCWAVGSHRRAPRDASNSALVWFVVAGGREGCPSPVDVRGVGKRLRHAWQKSGKDGPFFFGFCLGRRTRVESRGGWGTSRSSLILERSVRETAQRRDRSQFIAFGSDCCWKGLR